MEKKHIFNEHDTIETITKTMLDYQIERLELLLLNQSEIDQISILNVAIQNRVSELEKYIVETSGNDDIMTLSKKQVLRLYIDYMQRKLESMQLNIKPTETPQIEIDPLKQVYDLIQLRTDFDTFKTVIKDKSGLLDFKQRPLCEIVEILRVIIPNYDYKEISVITKGIEKDFSEYSQASSKYKFPKPNMKRLSNYRYFTPDFKELIDRIKKIMK